MISPVNTPAKKENILYTLVKSFSFLFVSILSLSFTFIGSYKLFKSMFTPYELTTLDAVELGAGISIFLLMLVLLLVADVREKTAAIGEAMLVLLKPQPHNIPSIGDIFKNMSGLSTNDPNISGSISVIDLSKGSEGKSVFKGDFNNLEELQQLKNTLLNNMLKSTGEFQGKKMTKEEMLDTLTIEELEDERVKAEEKEEWLWAAAIRDKIAEKKKNL